MNGLDLMRRLSALAAIASALVITFEKIVPHIVAAVPTDIGADITATFTAAQTLLPAVTEGLLVAEGATDGKPVVTDAQKAARKAAAAAKLKAAQEAQAAAEQELADVDG